MEAFARAEKKKKPNPEFLFTDVYDEMPPNLQAQMQHMKDHVNKYKDQYPITSHDNMTS